jgi:hypothetical protein
LAKDFLKFRSKGWDTFCPKFCPYYTKSKFFNSSAYMYLVVFYVGEYVWVWVGGCVCIQNRKVQNSLRSVGNCFASRSNFLLRCVRMTDFSPKLNFKKSKFGRNNRISCFRVDLHSKGSTNYKMGFLYVFCNFFGKIV